MISQSAVAAWWCTLIVLSLSVCALHNVHIVHCNELECSFVDEM